MNRKVSRLIRTAVFAATVVIALPAVAAAQSAAAPAPMAGTWNVSLIGDHVIPLALVLEQNGAALKGTLTIMGKNVAVTGELKGSAFSLAGKAMVGLQNHNAGAAAAAPGESSLTLDGVINDDGTLAGDFAVPNGTLKWTAERLRARSATAAQPATAPASAAGDWTMTLAVEPDPVVGALALQQSGATLTGTFISEHLGTLRISGTAANGKVAFAADGQAHGQDVHIEFTGAFKADGSLAGELTSPLGQMNWSASRVKK